MSFKKWYNETMTSTSCVAIVPQKLGVLNKRQKISSKEQPQVKEVKKDPV